MKRHVALLGTGLLVAAAGQAQAQAIQLRFTPQVGQVTHYRMTSRTWTSADTSGAAAMEATMYQTQTVLPMDGPNYVVRTSFDSTVLGGAGAGRPDMMRGMAVTVHQDPQGRVVSREVTPPPGLPAFVANMMTKGNTSNGPNSRMWPEGSISPGYTWTDSMPMTVGQGRNARQVMCHLTWKFDRVDHEGGARVAVVTTTASSAAGEACSGGGETRFDLDASRLVRSTMDMTLSGQSHVKTLMETLP
jgi:hypothetical protein